MLRKELHARGSLALEDAFTLLQRPLRRLDLLGQLVLVLDGGRNEVPVLNHALVRVSTHLLCLSLDLVAICFHGGQVLVRGVQQVVSQANALVHLLEQLLIANHLFTRLIVLSVEGVPQFWEGTYILVKIFLPFF